MTATCVAMIRIKEADKIISYWCHVISSKLESVLQAAVVEPGVKSPVSVLVDCSAQVKCLAPLSVKTSINY